MLVDLPTSKDTAALADYLDVAGQLMAGTTTTARIRALLAVLMALEDELLVIASCPTTELHDASLLIRVRDDLGGHLLAAAVIVETGGKAPDAGYDILRRAVVSTVANLGFVERSES